MKMIPGHVAGIGSLRAQGLKSEEISSMATNLYLFPTPFKSIYYLPIDDERRGWLIERPSLAIREALSIYLGTSKFYYSCATAEEFHGISWHPSGELHVVNTVRSGRIDLQARMERNKRKKTWRAHQVARILEFYGRKIIFHRGSVDGAKYKETPYGKFALPSQIKKDRKRFRENARKKFLERMRKGINLGLKGKLYKNRGELYDR
jgi:hypothetical protein